MVLELACPFVFLPAAVFFWREQLVFCPREVIFSKLFLSKNVAFLGFQTTR